MKHSLDPPWTSEAETLNYKYGYGYLVLPEKNVDYLQEVIADQQTVLFLHTIEEQSKSSLHLFDVSNVFSNKSVNHSNDSFIDFLR